VGMASSNSSIASVPSQVTVPAGASAVVVTVTGNKAGPASITATLSRAIANATVTAAEPAPLPPALGTAVPTFHCMGLYWKPPSVPGSGYTVCEYRKAGDAAWIRGPDMWYDSRNNECRGSVFYLDPDTAYEFQFSLVPGTPLASATGATWSETFPEGEQVLVPNQNTELQITAGGTPAAYKVYKPAVGGGVIDAGSAASGNIPQCISISAPYVIIRGLTLKNAQQHGIRLFAGAHHVVIENNDISNWGREDPRITSIMGANGWKIQRNQDSGIFAYAVPGLTNLVVQKNKIHDPRFGANPWDIGHPLGANGVCWEECGGNNVIRCNEIYQDPASGNTKYFMDGIGGGDNFSNLGFPGRDSDIYGNKVIGVMDDGIEAEGGGMNVRVWSNYIDKSATGVATTQVNFGPTYILRNVHNRARHFFLTRTWDNDDRMYFAKAATVNASGGGKRFVYHNTTLQHDPLPGLVQTQGVGAGLSGLKEAEPLTNTRSRNNIWHTWKDNWPGVAEVGSGNDIAYELTNGWAPGTNIQTGKPIYKAGHGPNAEDTGKYQLDVGSPGLDNGEVIPGINDGFLGTAPDRGAHESGKPDMVFGVSATGNLKP
jgi:hypothetical protein